MNRVLKFLGVFLLAVLVVFGGIIGFYWKSFSTFFDNRAGLMEGTEWVSKTQSLRGLSEYVAQNPQNVSLASVVVTAQDSAIYYQEDQPRTLGALANFFILTAYADLIQKGTFSSDETIEWDEISVYQLPDVDQAAHTESYNYAKEAGWMDDGSIKLSDALQLLVIFNDLALADYLWWNIDREYWSDLKENLSLTETEMPLPFSGLYIAISPDIQERATSEIVENWPSTDSDEFRNHIAEQSNRIVQEGSDRDQIIDFMKDYRLGNTFMEERDALALFPKTTAKEMVQIMQRLWENELINSEVSEQVKSWMRWQIEDQPELKTDFTDYGALFDTRMGLLNGIDFGTSAYTGDTTVQVLFFDKIPIGFWFHMSSLLMHQDFQQRLIFDPALIEQVQKELDHNSR
ncbi:MAG: hypothetical protein WEA58_10095 [Balneolaceae bacterium]